MTVQKIDRSRFVLADISQEYKEAMDEKLVKVSVFRRSDGKEAWLRPTRWRHYKFIQNTLDGINDGQQFAMSCESRHSNINNINFVNDCNHFL